MIRRIVFKFQEDQINGEKAVTNLVESNNHLIRSPMKFTGKSVTIHTMSSITVPRQLEYITKNRSEDDYFYTISSSQESEATATGKFSLFILHW